MKSHIVADSQTIINTQGIRFVEKVDRKWAGNHETKYALKVTYKGDVLDYEYQTLSARDAQFDRLREALELPWTVESGKADYVR